LKFIGHQWSPLQWFLRKHIYAFIYAKILDQSKAAKQIPLT